MANSILGNKKLSEGRQKKVDPYMHLHYKLVMSTTGLIDHVWSHDGPDIQTNTHDTGPVFSHFQIHVIRATKAKRITVGQRNYLTIFFRTLRQSHILFQHAGLPICNEHRNGQYSYKRKFGKYSYAGRKVVTLTHCGMDA